MVSFELVFNLFAYWDRVEEMEDGEAKGFALRKFRGLGFAVG